MKTLNNQIQDLANTMGLTFDDVKNFALSVASSIEQDKAGSAFINGTDSDRKDLTEAYVVDQAKKTERFATKAMTDPRAKEALILKLFTDLKAA